MKRTLTSFAVAAAFLSIFMLAPVYGQSARAIEFKNRVLAQISSAAARNTPVAVSDQRPPVPFDAPKNSIAGTWDLILTASDGSQVRSTLQMMPGASDGEGSALHASEFSLAPPSPTLPEQGSWRHLRNNQFIASYYGYSFDLQFQPVGKIGFRHTITLDRDQEHFTGQAVFEVLDLDGTVLFSDNFTTAGSKQRPRQ